MRRFVAVCSGTKCRVIFRRFDTQAGIRASLHLIIQKVDDMKGRLAGAAVIVDGVKK
jgi:hypothetical protein